MKRAIITGASEGLGLAIASLFLEKNIEVINLSRNKPPIDIIHIETDLTEEESIKQAIIKINEQHREFDILINCAGILNIQLLGDLDPTEIAALFKVNLFAPMILISGLIESIKQLEVDIVNIGSTVGYKAYQSQCAYTSSKWGMRGFNEYLQLEFKETRNRVIGFNPGGFKSDHVKKVTGEDTKLGPYMEPEELAKLIYHLLELPKNMEVSEIIINRK